MPLPVPLITAVIQAAFALRQAELETERVRLNVQFQMHLASLQQEYALARLAAEKEIILEVISISKHAFDRKMDFITNIYMTVHELIARHQQALLAEHDELKSRRFDGALNRSERLRDDARLSEVSIMLIDLETFSHTLGTDFAEIGRSLSPLS